MTAFILPAGFSKKPNKKSKRSHPEQSIQRQVAQFLSWALPDDVWFSSIGHGGGGAIRGAILKSTGMKAGVPDILIVYRGRPVFIELKTDKGVLSPAQKEVHIAITVAGGVVATCRSVDEVRDFLEVCGIKLQAKLMPAERATSRTKTFMEKPADREAASNGSE